MTPVSTRVHEAAVVARLTGRLETEVVAAVYAHVDRCPTLTNVRRLNCTDTSSSASQLPLPNCSRPAAETELSLSSVTVATDDAISHLMTEGTAWYKLSPESRNFLRSRRALDVVVNVSSRVLLAEYSTVVDELRFLLPVASPELRLPRHMLCSGGTETTALFTSASGLLSLALAQRAAASQCAFGHVVYACGGYPTASDRFYFRSHRFCFRLDQFYFRLNLFYFRSNWSRVESELRDFRHCNSDETTSQVYFDNIECPLRVLTAMATTVEQSRGCADVTRWYSACVEMLSGTRRLTEKLIGQSQQAIASARRCSVTEIVVYAMLICLQVSFQYT